MFTVIGKVLTYLNLLGGLAILTWSVSSYKQRPGWFDPVPERIEKGHDPQNFAMLKQEAEALAKTADAASGVWGENLKALKKVEARRNERQKELDRRLKWMRTGNPDQGGAAFFKGVYEKDATGKNSANLDLSPKAALGAPIHGPDDKPLRGVDTLLANFSADVKEVNRLALKVAEHRAEYASLTGKILDEGKRLDAMLGVRDAVQAELFYLETFELNVYETRTTVVNRRRQLSQRLAELGVGKKP